MAQGDWVAFSITHCRYPSKDAPFQNVVGYRIIPTQISFTLTKTSSTEQAPDTPIFKPDWSPDYFLSCNYLCHFTLMRREFVREVGGFRSEFDGAQDYDLFLRVIERTKPHPSHCRGSFITGGAVLTSTADQYPAQARFARRPAVRRWRAHLARRHVPGHVTVDWRTHAYWVKRELDRGEKSFASSSRCATGSIFPARCLESVTSKTAYAPYEIVVVDNDSQSAEAREYFATLRTPRAALQRPL